MSNLLAVAPFDFGAIFSNLSKRWYYYVALLVFLVAVVVVFLTVKKKRNNLNQTQKIVYTAIFSALAFVANYLTIPVSIVKQISLVATVGFIAGYTLGGLGGFVAAFIGDFICGIIAPFGPYNPIIGIGTGLWGLIPGIIFTFTKGNDFIKLFISFVLGFVFNSFLVNTLGLSLMYTTTFESLMVLLPSKLLVAAINAVISALLVPVLRKVLPKDKFPFVVNK